MFRNCVSGKKYSIIKSMNITQIREKIEETLKSYLPQTASQDWQKMNFGKLPAAIDETHFQQLLSPCFSLMSLGGKRWRPVLQVLCAMMVSNQKNHTTDVPESFKLTPLVEFVHTASLIHDDIEDGADTRRGKPAIHITYGIDTAIKAGSWLYFAAPAAIDSLDIPQEKKNIYYRLFTKELRRLHLGQAMDIYWHRNPEIFPTMKEYKAMVQNKTGTLSCLAVSLGVLSGGGTLDEAEKAGEIARSIGEGFQILDDVQNLTTGNPGKKRGDDIVEGKKSLPVLIHIENCPDDKEKISNYFQNAQKEGIISVDIENCIELLEKSGSIKKAFESGRALVKEKTLELVHLFEKSELLSEPAEQIISLFDQMLPTI